MIRALKWIGCNHVGLLKKHLQLATITSIMQRMQRCGDCLEVPCFNLVKHEPTTGFVTNCPQLGKQCPRIGTAAHGQMVSNQKAQKISIETKNT